jgi:hypothetical protein
MPEFTSIWQYLAWLSIVIVLAQGFRRMNIREAYVASMVRQKLQGIPDLERTTPFEHQK